METKPGWKTTEFWLTAAAALLGLAWASGFVPVDSTLDRVLGLVASALASLGYSVSRGLAKKNGSG